MSREDIDMRTVQGSPPNDKPTDRPVPIWEQVGEREGLKAAILSYLSVRPYASDAELTMALAQFCDNSKGRGWAHQHFWYLLPVDLWEAITELDKAGKIHMARGHIGVYGTIHPAKYFTPLDKGLEEIWLWTLSPDAKPEEVA